ncbi:MAG: hypothetical protein RL662_1198 [Bacteroidota bacterium]|jgi:hypothetical protein
MKIKNFAYILLSMCSIATYAQKIQGVLELSQTYNISSGADVVAGSVIRLLPGFSYKAEPNKNLRLRIATRDELAPRTVKLEYVENNGANIEDEYTGVRVGEYYWMNRNFMRTYDASTNLPDITKAQIDRLHQVYNMYEFNTCNNDRPDYWSQNGGVKLAEINSYFGQYISRHQAVDKMPEVGKLTENNSLNNPTTAKWDLPDYVAMQQLIAMCGYGTPPEFSQYAGYKYDPAKVHSQPSFVINKHFTGGQSFGSFYQSIQKVYYATNGHNPANNNKYGLNMVPAGVRPHATSPLKTENCQKEPHPFIANRGDLNGFEQSYQLRLKDNRGIKLSVDDIVQIKHNEEAQLEYQPVRWCRALTDEELGYKLYINQPTFTNSYGSLVDLNNKIAAGQSVVIIKLNLSEKAPSGYIELPKGYLRGFYVQFFIEEPNPTKTLAEILKIAKENPHIWASLRSATVSAASIDGELETSTVSVYPNPLTDVLNIVGDNIQKVELYDLTGRLVKQVEKANSLSVAELKGGMYIVKVSTASGVTNHKVIKK